MAWQGRIESKDADAAAGMAGTPCAHLEHQAARQQGRAGVAKGGGANICPPAQQVQRIPTGGIAAAAAAAAAAVAAASPSCKVAQQQVEQQRPSKVKGVPSSLDQPQKKVVAPIGSYDGAQ